MRFTVSLENEEMSKKKHVFLQSKRFDVKKYDTPELHWSFYDSFNQSKQSTAAVEAGKTSIVGANLEKFLKKTATFTKILTLTETIEALPHPYNEVLALQREGGEFRDLPSLLRILHLPRSLKVPRAENNLQSATALAIACMRQRIDLFDALQDSHDRACAFVHNGLINDARFLIAEYTLTPAEFEQEYNKYETQSLSSQPNFSTSSFTTTPTTPADTINASAVNASIVNAGAVNESTVNVAGSSSHASVSVVEDRAASEIPRAVSSSTYSSSSSSPINPSIKKEHQDEIQLEKQKIEGIELEIIQLVLKLDARVNEVKDCLQMCIVNFLKSEVLSEKNSSFDELTAR
jgi:hypothetical protein